MLNAREFALAVAIVFVLSSWFIDRQILYGLVELLRASWGTAGQLALPL